MFENSGFEIYETATKTFVIDEVHNQIGGPSKHMLEVREVLDDIKNRFYDLEEATASFADEHRERVSMLWAEMLRKLTGPICLQGCSKHWKN